MLNPELETYFPVLDKGYVRLVDAMGSDLSIVRAARVSHGGDDKTGENLEADKKLLRYLWQHAHTSPFESVTFTFEVKAPIFVFRQWHRHRTQSYNEISARYTELPDEFYVPSPSVIGAQSSANKQARNIRLDLTDIECGDIRGYIASYELTCRKSFEKYKELLNEDWPRELARMCLPLSTYSRMYSTMNLLNCLKFLTLRLDPHAQWEIQQYAKAIRNLIVQVVPWTVETWEAANRD